MRHKTQDPKYDIEDDRLVNASSGEPIPADEPILILRAKDVHAVQALYAYQNLCENESHVQAVAQRIEEFEDFAIRHRGRMKEPDTAEASND